MDKHSEAILKELYSRFQTEKRFSVCEPEYSKDQIVYLMNQGLITGIESSPFDAWSCIIEPTQEGKFYFSNKSARNKAIAKQAIWEIVKFAVPTIISIIALIRTF